MFIDLPLSALPGSRDQRAINISPLRVCRKKAKDATGLSGGASRWLLEMRQHLLLDATALGGGVSRSLLFVAQPIVSSKREPPRGKPVASEQSLPALSVATSTGQAGGIFPSFPDRLYGGETRLLMSAKQVGSNLFSRQNPTR
jgi:hypothetical protein